MKKKLNLRIGDIITLVEDKNNTKNLIVYTVKSRHTTSRVNIIFKNTLMAKFIEYLGTNYSRTEKTQILRKIPKEFRPLFKNLEVIEIKRKEKWYITILNKLRYLILRK